MWIFVHSFPDGYRPQPKVQFEKGAVVSLERQNGNNGKIARIVVESGKVDIVNVPLKDGAQIPARKNAKTELKLDKDVVLPPSVSQKDTTAAVQILAPEVVDSQSKTNIAFGVENVPVVLKAGVNVVYNDVEMKFAPAAFNPKHAKYIARSEKAKPMAINMYSGFWSLVVCVAVTVLVSLVTKPKPESELKDLVMGCTVIPDEGPCPWYENPKLWATVVFIVLVLINIIFW